MAKTLRPRRISRSNSKRLAERRRRIAATPVGQILPGTLAYQKQITQLYSGKITYQEFRENLQKG